MGGNLNILIGLGVLAAIGVVFFLVRLVKRGKSDSQSRLEADATPGLVVPAAGPPPPQGHSAAGNVFSRESLIARDRELDTARWDNRPDGTEEYEDGVAPAGEKAIDAGFIAALRERERGEGA